MTKVCLFIQLIVLVSMGCGEAPPPPLVALENQVDEEMYDNMDASPYSDEREDEGPVICEDNPVPVSLLQDNGYVFRASTAFIDGLERLKVGKDAKKTFAACNE